MTLERQEMKFAKEYAEILTGIQGRYSWGERDCVALVARIVNELTVGTFTDDHLKEWHGLPFHKAIERGVKEHGSLEAAYAHGLEKTGGFTKHDHELVSMFAMFLMRGAVSVCMPPIMTAFNSVSADHPVLVFTDPSNVPWTWAESGLVRVSSVQSVHSMYLPIFKD